jgi:hypothetical protein
VRIINIFLLFWFIIGFALIFLYICDASIVNERRKAYYPILQEEHQRLWPEAPIIIFDKQIKAESAWKEQAIRLERSGVTSYGLLQVLDVTFEEMKKKHPTLLNGEPVQMLQARWGIRAGILYNKQMYNLCSFAQTEMARWCMALSSYNGGFGNLQRDRKLTEKNAHNKNLWFSHVEKFSKRSQWAFKINRCYVKEILNEI